MKILQIQIGTIVLIGFSTCGLRMNASADEPESYESQKTKLLSPEEKIAPSKIDTQLYAALVGAIKRGDSEMLYRLLTERHNGLSVRTCLAIKQLPQKQRVQCLILILSSDSFWALLPDDEYSKGDRDLRYNALVSITGAINDTLGDGYTLRAILYSETRRGIIQELNKLSSEKS